MVKVRENIEFSPLTIGFDKSDPKLGMWNIQTNGITIAIAILKPMWFEVWRNNRMVGRALTLKESWRLATAQLQKEEARNGR